MNGENDGLEKFEEAARRAAQAGSLPPRPSGPDEKTVGILYNRLNHINPSEEFMNQSHAKANQLAEMNSPPTGNTSP